MFPLHGSDILTFESVSEIEECDYSNEPTKQYFSVVLFIMLHEVIFTFETVGKKIKTQQEKKKQMNNLKSYRLSGACNFSRRVYSLPSKRRFRALFKNQPNKLIGATQG